MSAGLDWLSGDEAEAAAAALDVRPSWQAQAACAGMAEVDPQLFFPERHTGWMCLEEARAICGRCPVRVACLDYAMTHSIRHGIWGGTSEKERRDLRRRRREAT